MIWLALLLAADPGLVARGEKLFGANCAIGYCHGVAGAANRGPRLKGRNFAVDYLDRVIRDGIPKSAMPGFRDRLKDEDVKALLAYVASLGDGGPPEAAPAPVASAAPAGPAHPGTAMFVEKCGGCHAARGKGEAVGPGLAKVTALPSGPPKLVRAVKLKDGETFPAVVLAPDGEFVPVWDLTEPPPVRRMLEKAEIVSADPAKAWTHPAGLTPVEWNAILGFVNQE